MRPASPERLRERRKAREQLALIVKNRTRYDFLPLGPQPGDSCQPIGYTWQSQQDGDLMHFKVKGRN